MYLQNINIILSYNMCKKTIKNKKKNYSTKKKYTKLKFYKKCVDDKKYYIFSKNKRPYFYN